MTRFPSTISSKSKLLLFFAGAFVQTAQVANAETVLSVSQITYDADGRLQCMATRMNPAVFGSLPSSACTLGTQGSNGPDRITKNVYDAASQIIQVRKAVGTSSPNLEQAFATYSYTSNGKREYVIDANGNKAKLEYDGFDRQIKWIFPSTARPTAYNPATQATALSTSGNINSADYEQYGYDSNGNRTSLRKRDTQTIGYTYDALNRVTFKDIPGTTSLDVYYGYDLRGLQLFARFSSTSGQGITNGYNTAGRPTSSANNVGGTNRTLAYQYDKDGNRTRLTWPDSNYVTFSYDALNRMTLVKQSGSTTVATFVYNSRGERDCWYASSSSNCSVAATNETDYSYDPISRLASIKIGRAHV
jgi:YD repeat-containing protein